MEKGCNTRLDEAQYNKNSSNAPFIQQSLDRIGRMRKKQVRGQTTNCQSGILNRDGAHNGAKTLFPPLHALVISMLDDLPNMVFVKDATLRFIYVNKAGEELLGYSRSELLGKNDYDFFPQLEADLFTANDRDVLKSGRLLDIPQERIQTRCHGVRVLHTKKVAICDAESRAQYLLGISEDITERNDAEKVLQSAYEESAQRVIDRTRDLTAANATLHDLSGRLIHAQEEERSRIARDLHDDVCQQLALMAIEMEDLGLRPPSSGSEVSARCRELWAKTREISTVLHRLSHQLHPSKLDHLGLDAAVRSLCNDITRLHHVTTTYRSHGLPESLPKTVALFLYRVTQEALQNVVKHSGAREAQVEVSADAGMLSVTISDSGVGFDPHSPENRTGLGMTSMEERVRRIGGTLSICSLPSRGTTITAQVQLNALNRV